LPCNELSIEATFVNILIWPEVDLKYLKVLKYLTMSAAAFDAPGIINHFEFEPELKN